VINLYPQKVTVYKLACLSP